MKIDSLLIQAVLMLPSGFAWRRPSEPRPCHPLSIVPQKAPEGLSGSGFPLMILAEKVFVKALM